MGKAESPDKTRQVFDRVRIRHSFWLLG